MSDLVLAVALLLAISTLLFFLSRFVASRASRRVAVLMATAAAAFVCAFGMLAYGKLIMAQWLPVSSVVILGNWMAPGMAVLAGVVAAQTRIARWRRALFLLPLIGLAVYSIGLPFLGRAVAAEDNWSKDGVCLQSCEASCSPAAAATLLKRHCIAVTEPEMTALCLTREEGTPSLAVYRGLTLKTRSTPWRVEIVRGDVDELLSTGRPALLRIRLDEDDRQSIAPWAWSTGIGHAVVLLSVRSDGQLEIADPAIGRVRWTKQELQQRWRGEALRLVRVERE